ncbi:unnamed protein product [Caenorhabditis auriculariae]|uniref:Nuclear receptor domain-containing protein n=1 Tax=Caenorhabditis auriculariae TaxID=2777116 RepID=A0A8S1HN11_9PELO|nr:unnamed protein product [Caenorhabditis auriculariae]
MDIFGRLEPVFYQRPPYTVYGNDTFPASRLYRPTDKEQEQRTHVVGPLQRKTEKCRVCSREGASLHYGGVVCGGCKIFFARAVKNPRGFACERQGSCEMGPGRRSKCRSCRLNLCYKARMRSEAVGQVRDLRTKEEDSTDESLPTTSSASPAPESKPIVSIISKLEYQRIDPLEVPSTSMQARCHQIRSHIDMYPSFDDRAIVAMFHNIERNCDNNLGYASAGKYPSEFSTDVPVDLALLHPRPISDEVPIAYVRKKFSENPEEMFKEFYCRTIVHFFAWTSAIEDFSQLNMRQRKILAIEAVVPGCLMMHAFGMSQWRVKNGAPKLPTSSEIDLKTMIDDHPHLKEVIETFQFHVLEPMNVLQITAEEYSCIRLILLWSGGESVLDMELARALRDRYGILLMALLRAALPDAAEEEVKRRYSQLFEYFNSVKTISTRFVSWMTMMFARDLCGMRDTLIYDLHVHSPGSTTGKVPKEEKI